MKHAVMEGFRLAFLGRMRMQGYKVAGRIETDGIWTVIEKNEIELCRLNVVGDLFFNRNQFVKQEQKEVVQLFKDMREVYRLFDRAEPFSAIGEGGFRLIAEMGKAVLAAKMKQNQELSFVTWEYDYDDTGVHWGHYYESNFQSKKKDFVVRAGLVDEKQFFSKEELMVLHSACTFRRTNDDTIRFDDEKQLLQVMEKLVDSLPELEESWEHAEEQEQGGEHGIQYD